MSASVPSSPWIVRPRGFLNASSRLNCFPHAGGGSATFRGWQESFGADVEVCVVLLPARERRIFEPPIKDALRLSAEIATHLSPLLDRPYSFFGHSLGGLLAFETTRELRRRGRVLPECLAVSAYRAPQLPDEAPMISELSDAAFLDEVDHRYGSIPPEARANAELLELVLPALRADIAVCESYRHSVEAPLDCPLHVFGGEQDTQVTREELEAWRELTSGKFSLELLPGDHFFLQSSRDVLIRALKKLTRRDG